MEIAQAFDWVDTTMRADTQLVAALPAGASGNIFQGMADMGTVPPYVSYGKQADGDVNTVNGIRIYSSILMRIIAAGPSKDGGYAVLTTIANRIDALFGSVRPTGLPGGGGVLEAYRESQVALEVLVTGVQWSYLGGLYRIDVQGH